jgi:hypothetical protein
MYRRIWWSEIQIDRRILMKRNSNRCTSIVAFWWSEIQIDRRIVIERNSNWYIVESRELERRRVCRVSPFESEDEYIESHDESEEEYVESCDYLVERDEYIESRDYWERRRVFRVLRVERRWVCRILRIGRRWVCRIPRLRAKTSMSSLAIRAKMSMSSLAFGERRRVCRVLRFWDYNIIRCCDACLVDGICFHCVCINIGRSFHHFPSEQILLFHWLMSSHCLHFPN